MVEKIKIVMTSKDDSFLFTDDKIGEFYQNNPGIENNVSFVKIKNNSENITKVYNEVLMKERENISNDFVMFFHADVVVDLKHLIDHVIECKDKYDIFGLCGCQKIHTSHSPLNWFTGSMQLPLFRWGCVTHGEDGNRTSFFSKDRESVTDSPVACIDGLCIIFGKKSLESDIVFDERLRFNCYDTQISFDAVMNKNLRLGVVVEPSLIHNSIGKSILNYDFLNDEIILRERFGFKIPENSPLANMIESKKSTPHEVKLV